VSTRRHHRRSRPLRPTVSRSQAEQLAAISCALRGCTCTPELRYVHVAHSVGYLAVAHDETCKAAGGEA
jgi:hypothetical protein